MTRIAIVAESEQLRAALASALGASAAFDVLGATATIEEASSAAEAIVEARAPRAAARASVSVRESDTVSATAALTNREREVLALLAEGLGNKQIAARLGISTSTVKTHLELLFEKLEVSSRAEAVATAVRLGLLLL